MGYRKPGYVERSYGYYLPQDVSLITGGKNWDAEVIEALTLNGVLLRSNRRLSSIQYYDLFMIQTKLGRFSPGSPEQRALIRVIAVLLKELGVLTSLPTVVGYEPIPQMSLSDAISEMLTPHIKNHTIAKMKEQIRGDALWGHFVSAVPNILRTMAHLQQTRMEYTERLRRYLQHVGHKILVGMPITQAEMTFYLHYCVADTPSDLGWSVDDPKPWSAYPAQSEDPLMKMAWEAYQSSVEHGPYLRFASLASNADKTRLIAYFGPHVSTLNYTTGFITSEGPAHQLHIKNCDAYNWSLESQIAALAERAGYVVTSPTSLNIFTPWIARGAPAFQAEWDVLGEVNLSLESKKKLHEYEVQFFSDVRNRMLSTKDGATPDTWLTDLAYLNTAQGHGETAGTSLESGLYDFSTMAAPLQSKLTATTTSDIYEDIYVPGVNGMILYKVKMTQFYTNISIFQVPPAFAEYAVPPLSSLYEARPLEEEYIRGRCALDRVSSLASELTVRISHNAARLARIMPSANLNAKPLELAAAIANKTATIEQTISR